MATNNSINSPVFGGITGTSIGCTVSGGTLTVEYDSNHFLWNPVGSGSGSDDFNAQVNNGYFFNDGSMQFANLPPHPEVGDFFWVVNNNSTTAGWTIQNYGSSFHHKIRLCSTSAPGSLLEGYSLSSTAIGDTACLVCTKASDFGQGNAEWSVTSSVGELYIPSSMAVGAYVDCTATEAMSAISSVGWTNIANSYNGPMIFGFGFVGPILNSGSSFYEYSEAGTANAYIPNSPNFRVRLLAATGAAKLAGFGVRLLSFGGSWYYNNGGESSFNASAITTANIATLATNMVQLALDYNCNGIDFDFEMIPTYALTSGLPTDGDYSYSIGGITATKQFIADLVTNIRTAYTAKGLSSPFYIASAPQISDVGSGNLGLVSAENYQIYDTVLGATGSASFDYLLPQVYNSGAQYDPKFIKTNWTQIFSSMNASSTTKIMPGYPATAGSAGAANIFHGYSSNGTSYSVATGSSGYNWTVANIFDSSATTGNQWYWTQKDLRDTLVALKAGASTTYKNFAGVFCWQLSRDYFNWSQYGGSFEPGFSTAVVQPWTPNPNTSNGVGNGAWGTGMRNILGV